MTVPVLNPEVLFPEGPDVNKPDLWAKLYEIDNRLGGAPLSYAAFDVGLPMVLGRDGHGPRPASQDAEAISMAQRPLAGYRADAVDVDADLTLRGNVHLARLIRKKSTGAALIRFDPHPDPSVGVQDGFACTLMRYPGAGGLQVLSGMTNLHPNGHTRVQAFGIALLYVDTEANAFWLAGATEL